MKEVLRTCHVCRTKQNKLNMNRIVKQNDDFVVDNNKLLSGRAIYICKNNECLNIMLKKRTLNRMYRTNINEECYIKLIEELSNCK